MRYLFDDECRRLIAACAPDFRMLVEAALLTGYRYGELCRLQVGDLDLRAGTLHICETKSGNPRSRPPLECRIAFVQQRRRNPA